MRFAVLVKKKVAFDAFTQKMIDELETKIEEIQNVRTAVFDQKSSHVYVEYDLDDDESETDINVLEFLQAVNKTKYFQFVTMTS